MWDDPSRSEFIESLNLDDRSQSIRFWRSCVPPQPAGVDFGAFVQAAFTTLEVWNREESQSVDDELARGLMGVFSVLRQAAERRPKDCRRIAERLVPYCFSRNINISGEAVVFFRFFPALIGFAAPTLIRVAALTESAPKAPSLSLRGVAFRTLYHLNSKYAELKELSQSHHDYIRALFHWSQTCRLNIHAEEYSLLANTLIWHD